MSGSVVLVADLQRVWDALVDPQAVRWLVPDCVLSIPAPGHVDGVGALRCCWLQQPDGGLLSGVYEVVEFEPLQRIAYLEGNHPRSAGRIDIRLDQQGDSVTVSITISAPASRFGRAKQAGRVEQHGRDLIARAKLALDGRPATPVDLAAVLGGPGPSPVIEVFSIEIAAPVATTWPLVDDETGELIPSSTRQAEWVLVLDGLELRLQLHRHNDVLTCSVAQVIRHGPHHVTTRWAFGELEHEVLPNGSGSQVRLTRRRHPRVNAGTSPTAVENRAYQP